MDPLPHLPGKFVWFEHASADVPAARRFYEGLLGWHVEGMPMGELTYHMILCGQDGIGGFRTAEPGQPSHWISYLSVGDVDAVHAKALSAGATQTFPPTDFGAIGRASGIVDPTGASLSLWKGQQGDRPDVEQVAVGDWYWNELMTPDDQRALAFYRQVFGFGHDAMDMGAQGTYHILKTGEKMRAGLMKTPMPDVPTQWQPYVRVADCDATAARAPSLGGQVVVPPTDIPQVGRFAVIVDPLGAGIAVITPVE
ncbi:MAG: VOC family protein [Piscinibacter sp.]|nr:VOC family protein [Piscinibacter sp.]